MGDRLQQELLAVPGLESVTALQLQDLPWKSREQILIALFHEHTTSASVAEELRTLSRDRRLERKAEKTENADREAMRKSEDRFRSEFMQLAAKELARLGAPTMITWQKLVFDKDCCAQAFRLLLTKIKSSRRISSSNHNNSTSASGPRRPIALAKRFTESAPEEANENDDGRDEDGASDLSPLDASNQQSGPSYDTVLPRLGPKSTVKKSAGAMLHRKSISTTQPSAGWNSDTSVLDTDERERYEEPDAPFGAADFSIQRTQPKHTLAATQASSSFTTKLKKSQVMGLQHENAALASENKQLKLEISHLETLVETLQATATSSSSDRLQDARMKLLQAQNTQLQRQISLFQDAIQERDMVQSMLHTSLSHWREVVDAGRQEARAAGAEDAAKTKDGKPVQWMLAVPERLLDELNRIESQLQHAAKTMSVAMEAKLRVGGTAAQFLKSSASSTVSMGDMFVAGVSHLRVERVKRLEAALAESVRSIEAVYDDIIQSTQPVVQDPEETSVRGRVDSALASLRRVVMEVGAFGIVVPCHQTSRDGDRVTAAHVQRMFSSSSSTGKDREKQLKAMLKQLLASEAANDRDHDMTRKEATYWKQAWAMQEQLLHTLVHRVRAVGDKKLQWIEAHLLQPLAELQDVWKSFQQAQRHDPRIHKNAYLPLLIDTLQRHEPTLCMDAVAQWPQLSTRANEEIDAVVEDYHANSELLRGYLSPSTTTASPARS